MRSWRTFTYPATVSSAPDLTSRVVRHERAILACGIALLAALSWWVLASGAGIARAMDVRPPFAALVLMWWIMMAAMMLPSALPALLLYARVRDRRHGAGSMGATWMFAAGYLAVWLAFALAAASIQWFAAGPAMRIANERAAGALLLIAGVYQLSPLKGACLRECRSPAQFLSMHWRAGAAGALRLGLLHGGYCVACCWLLMALLFVVGVMNLLWVIALTIIIAAEKIVPRGPLIGQALGVALIAWGAVRLLA